MSSSASLKSPQRPDSERHGLVFLRRRESFSTLPQWDAARYSAFIFNCPWTRYCNRFHIARGRLACSVKPYGAKNYSWGPIDPVAAPSELTAEHLAETCVTSLPQHLLLLTPSCRIYDFAQILFIWRISKSSFHLYLKSLRVEVPHSYTSHIGSCLND